MVDIDSAFSKLKEIAQEFRNFCENEGKVSESDTRVKLIDKILIEVCGWPETNIKRESHSDSGFSDYILTVNGKPCALNELAGES